LSAQRIQEAERSFTQRGSTGTEKALMVEYTVRVYTMNIPRFFLLSCYCCRLTFIRVNYIIRPSIPLMFFEDDATSIEKVDIVSKQRK
jgi:hypothetical protein